MSFITSIRVALGYLAAFSASVGFWALLAPRSFYADFPGLGRTWVSIDGPYNEHLVRDVGALNLALLALVLLTMRSPTPQMLTTTGTVVAIWGVPHLAYHLFNTEGMTATDLVANLGGLAAFVFFAGALLHASRTITRPERATP